MWITHAALSPLDHKVSTYSHTCQRHISTPSPCALACLTVGLELFLQVDAESGQLAPFIQLLNVDTCNRTGPAVPIRLTTSTNSSIVLFPDGTNESVGDISVRPLSCSDSHTQVYAVLVSSPENYTLFGEMVNSMLPISCIIVPVPSESLAYSTACVACKHLTCLIASHHF